jgi:hypothetical protein
LVKSGLEINNYENFCTIKAGGGVLLGEIFSNRILIIYNSDKSKFGLSKLEKIQLSILEELAKDFDIT